MPDTGSTGFVVRPIGRVRSPVAEPVDLDCGAVGPRIVLEPAYRPGLRGLDAIDATPVLDPKPHFPAFDAPEQAAVPEWVTRLMSGYF